MNKLISGQIYSLREIFSGENDKIIIPDLQRDYCWGNPFSKDSETSLVDSFLDSILKLDQEKDITMGLIYGYYNELQPNRLQLCDGQQRLTTLFLILGVINRYSNNKYREILISDFELEEDDKEPHLLYAIRENSIYFLSDLTTNYFMNPNVHLEQIEKQNWFLNSYKQDPTVNCIIRALHSIEKRLVKYEHIDKLGEFLIEHLMFLFYDMDNRQNGEETFVVINTTGEPLTANQNLKPLVIMNNKDYSRSINNPDGTTEQHNTAQDWEEMETWFWKHRRLNNIDTSTEGIIAFLHCVRVLESSDEAEWHHNIDVNDDKFPENMKMENIWEWFCAYKRMYELDYRRMCVPNIVYPERQLHYTQRDLYAILPTMVFCRMYKDATDKEIQRVYHLFFNMGRYRPVTRSSQNDAISVPAFRATTLIQNLPSKDIISFIESKEFKVDEEITKLLFLKEFQEKEDERIHIEELFANAENFDIFEGRISTLVNWSQKSIEKLDFIFHRIKELWMKPNNLNTLRRALLAFNIDNYPMVTGTANMTLCSGTEWRTLFERQGEQIIEFINCGSIEEIIENHKDFQSPFYPLIHDETHLDFSRDHNIRVYPKGVVELLEKTRTSADFRLFHNGQVFEKNMIDRSKWDGFWIWSDGTDVTFYSDCYIYNITLEMYISEDGYKIVAWTDRRPNKPSVKTTELEDIGFEYKDNKWSYPTISSPYEAKQKFIEITQRISN